jgi:hypothetical protein
VTEENGVRFYFEVRARLIGTYRKVGKADFRVEIDGAERPMPTEKAVLQYLEETAQRGK